MPSLLDNPALLRALLAVTALGAACALLSVLVVLRRWAFIGEGISHGGFGGAGTVWLLAVLFPAAFDNRPALPYAGVVVACFAAAVVIGYLSRAGRVNADAAIGIFLVASLAWGFMAQGVYAHFHNNVQPAGWDNLFLGRLLDITPRSAVSTVGLCAAVIAAVALLQKEILSYCFDPVTSEVSGVRSGMIHYLLLALVAVTIIVGAPIAGAVLVTALLVLPGATALLLSSRLSTVVTLSIACGVTGGVGGLLITHRFPFVPAGPAIVLVLVTAFAAGYLAAILRQRRGTV